MATRSVSPPSMSVRAMDSFRGASQDRGGVEHKDNEFWNLTNWRNYERKSLKKRRGGIKSFGQTHTAGSKVRGLHTFRDDNGVETYIKMANQKLYKSTGGSWTEISSGAPTWADRDCWFATIKTKATGASNTESGTNETSTAVTLVDTDKTFTNNQFVGQILSVGGEKKLITGTDPTTIYIPERFDNDPSAASYTINPRQSEFFIANGTNFYKCDGTTLTQLDTSAFAYAFDGVVAHAGRLFGWKGNRLHWSDFGSGEHFSRNSWRDFTSGIQCAVPLGADMLMIYEEERVTVMFGDSADTFTFQDLLNGIGTDCPKTVANFHGLYQFFTSRSLGVCIITANAIQRAGDAGEPLSVSEGYVQNLLGAQSEANMNNACASVHEDSYHLCVDDDWYVLNVRASEQSRFADWVWTFDNRPDAMDANILGHFGTKFVAGAQDNGQVYEIEKDGIATDDGETIHGVIEKKDWNVGNARSVKKFWALAVTQALSVGSPSASISASASPSTSPSASRSPSASASPSPSATPSVSPSASDSPSASVSPSSSASPSPSPSTSPSASVSPSVSPSLAQSAHNMFYFAATDGGNYGSVIKTINLLTAESDEHRIPITSNDSAGRKNTGKKLSFKITESIPAVVPDITKIELLYFPGIVR